MLPGSCSPVLSSERTSRPASLCSPQVCIPVPPWLASLCTPPPPACSPVPSGWAALCPPGLQACACSGLYPELQRSYSPSSWGGGGCETQGLERRAVWLQGSLSTDDCRVPCPLPRVGAHHLATSPAGVGQAQAAATQGRLGHRRALSADPHTAATVMRPSLAAKPDVALGAQLSLWGVPVSGGRGGSGGRGWVWPQPAGSSPPAGRCPPCARDHPELISAQSPRTTVAAPALIL